MRSRQDDVFLRRFGIHLKGLRERRGLSLRELSYRCEIDNSKISKIEQGSVNITLRTILQLSEALDIEPTEMLQFPKE
jgi:transcriptional regulator with XRE-family HTH domain